MRHVIFSLAAVAFFTVAGAQPNTAEFSEFIQSSYTQFDLPSISVAVVKDGKTILTQSFGKRSESDPQAPDGNTMYAIASLSKAFTAASIGMLVDEGKLDWKDKVIEHLPWFALHDPYVTEHLTVEDLLCHRSGLITFDGDLLWYGSSYNRREIVERIRHEPLTYGFREEFGYQNIMFMTAGEVIAKVSGMSWDDFVKTRILVPLGMNRTTSHFEEFVSDFNSAKPFLKGEEIMMLSYDNSGATAALNSSVNDMSKWMNLWLSNGIVNGDTLLSAASIKRIWELHTPLPTSGFDQKNGIHFKGYGLGWFTMDYQGRKVIHHGGGLPGYISKVVLVPEENLGIVVLTNDMNSVPSMLTYAVIDWALGKDYKHWQQQFLEMKQKGEQQEMEEEAARLQTKKADPRLLPIEDYIGLYRDKRYGDVRIAMGENGLIISFLPTKELFTGKMEPWGDHAFRFDHNDPFLTYGVATFKVELDVVKGFTIDLPNYDFHFNKLYFEKVQ